jgi:hypothetical protein
MSITPKKLAVYYGWPSSVNATYTVNGAAAVFKDYDMVVFGAGLEDSGHGDHQNTIDIINHQDMANTEVYGYVDTTAGQSTNETNIDNWATMGVAGIFCDRFGYDFSVTRSQQNSLVDYIHGKSLKAFVNAWNPDDAFKQQGGPSGATHLGSSDWYLAESYQIINGSYQSSTDWKNKADKMAGYKSTFGTKMATVTTTNTSTFDQDKFDYAYFSTVLYNFDAAGWGEENFSATSASLPFRTRKSFLGTSLTNSISSPSSNVYQRNTNIGILVDTTNHTVGTLLQ